MRDFLVQHFGDWIWYQCHNHTIEYERLRFSLLFLNLILILALWAVLAWGSRREWFRSGLDPAARKIIRVLLGGLLFWVFQYSAQIYAFQPDLTCDTAFGESESVLAKVAQVFAALTSICFFLAGSYLLELGKEKDENQPGSPERHGEKRFHNVLRSPTPAGISLSSMRLFETQLPGISQMLGNSTVRIVFGLVTMIALWPALTWPDWAVGRTFDPIISCIAYFTFGMGLLRELNRERCEVLGVASAASMLIYSGVQFSAIWKELLFYGYGMAALLKLALLLTMVGFGVLVVQTARARRGQRADFIELLIALNSKLEHELKKPITTLDARIGTLETVLREKHASKINDTREAHNSIKNYFVNWDEGLRSTPISLKELLNERKFATIPKDNDDLYEVKAPKHLLGFKQK